MSDDKSYSRKDFFGSFFSLMKRGVNHQVDRKLAKILNAPLRPPGSLDEVEFLSACTRCEACVEACPPGVILKQPYTAGVAAGAPYIRPDTGPCQLCPDLPCISACPTDALSPVDSVEDIHMGRAVVNTETCRTYGEVVCTACYDACPFPERALTLDGQFHPQVLDACIGCGACRQACPVHPAGIEVVSHLNLRGKDKEHFLLEMLDGDTPTKP